MRSTSWALVGALSLAACHQERIEAPTAVAAVALATSPTSVSIRFTAPIDARSVGSGLAVQPLFRASAEPLPVEEVRVEGDTLTLTTASQRGGQVYAVLLGALSFTGIAAADAPTQVNFVGYGTAPVLIRLDPRGRVVPGPLSLLLTASEDGTPSDELRARPLSADSSGVYTATVSLRIALDHTYGARAVVASDQREAGALTTFTVTSTALVVVELSPRLPLVPEFDPPVDLSPGDGKAPVRIILDDRLGRALVRPALRVSLDDAGAFDLSLSKLATARPVPGKPRVYEVLLEAKVDPARRLDGTTADTFPYVSFLVNKGEDVNERGVNFVMPEEAPKLIILPIGNPNLVPVTFRVDVTDAILEPNPSVRGVYPGEGVFLTGEFAVAEDALGRLASDTFSGGERPALEMEERPDAPGIYERTIFLSPNRPYGWKVVRCPSGLGCAELNRHVLSSGRAFPTVMKNLVTANVDAALSPTTRLIDPADRAHVMLAGGQVADYSAARVSETGMEAPSPSVMFKQEAPDLVVTVGTTPLFTPIYVVGTWRDVNIPAKPSEIIASMSVLALAPYDYDDGLAGKSPLVRARTLPVDPGLPQRMPGQPAFVPTDGALDASAFDLGAGAARLPLALATNDRWLYVSTSLAVPGEDHFILISLDAPSELLPSQWSKAGQGAVSPRLIFLAMEGDGAFAGWFRRGRTGADDTAIAGAAALVGRGGVLEGAVDLSSLGLGAAPSSVWVAAVAYDTADGGALRGVSQNPAGNGDGVLDLLELRQVNLSDVRAE